MPWQEFWQPVSDSMPEWFEGVMRPKDQNGWPGAPVSIQLLDENYYYDCNLGFIQEQCQERVAEDLNVVNPPTSEVDACVSINLNKCGQVLFDSLPFEDGWVQMRGCNVSDGCSGWSNPVPVPEPASVAVQLFICIAVLVGVAAWRRSFR